VQKRSLAPEKLTQIEVPIRGRDQPMTVSTAEDPTLLASLLEEQARSVTAEEMSAKVLV
jgi:hypothetical protein